MDGKSRMRKTDDNKWDKKRLIIESFVAILCVIIGNIWGKSSTTNYYNGQKITETELNAIMEENAEYKSSNDELKKNNEILTVKLESVTKDNDNYKKINQEFSEENKSMKEKIESYPALEFKNIGLVIDGEEQTINKNQSIIIANGIQYFSGDFIDSLVGENKSVSIKDDTMYIGKIIAEQTQLSKQWVITKSNVDVGRSVVDSFGNNYTDAFVFYNRNNNIKIKLDKKYAMLKAKVSIKENSSSNKKGYIEILADDVSVYKSGELNLMTQVFDIDIPINNANVLTINYNADSDNVDCIISNAFVYN